MIKILSLLALWGVFFGVLFADKINESISINIEKIDTKSKTATFPAYDLEIGESGFVLSKLKDYSLISASLEIKSIENGVATARIYPFNSMKQIYLPTPRTKPKAGDMAVFRNLNDKAFLIAPNSLVYEKIKSENKDIDFMSSDLLMGYLSDYGGFDPKPKFFQKVCSAYSVGLLYIVGTNQINVLDCQSLISLKSIPFDTSKVQKTIAPFFSRLQDVKTGSLASLFYSKKSKNYFEYYDRLIKEGKSFK